MEKTATIKTLAAVFALTALVGTAEASKANLPFLANDLKPGERWATRDHANNRSQKYGYDLSVRRYRGKNKTWSHLKPNGKNSVNSDHLAYNKPIYAMEDGTVIKCWRNAPNNPTPGGRHSQAKRMPGGGNELWIQHSDGKRTLYAHFNPASIPKALCPHSKSLFDTAGVSEIDVPVALQAKIKKGQFIGRVGNSGASSAPHLHTHKELNGNGRKLVFHRGLATNYTSNKANINSWKSFSGKNIPRGDILIWPHRRLAGEYARHQFPAKNYKRLHKHLSNSGFAPEWFDGYSVNKKTFFNFVWRPAKTSWLSYFGQTASQFQTRFNQARAKGLSPVHVESYLSNNKIRYAVIFKKTSGKWLARHGLTASQHQAVFNQAVKDKLTPIDISVVSRNNKRSYTVLYRKRQIGSWQAKSQLDSSAYQKAVNANIAAGRSPFYINSYIHRGKTFYSAIFAQKPRGRWQAKHGLTSSAYQAAWNSSTKKGMATQIVTGSDGAKSKHRFAAMWR